MTQQKRVRIGITAAYDDGADDKSLQPGTILHFVSQPYVRAVEKAGAIPLLLPVIASDAALLALIDTLDGLLLSGGGGVAVRRHPDAKDLPTLEDLSPARYRFESRLARAALDKDVPVLGICRGHQVLAEVVGGTLHQNIQGQVPKALEHRAATPPVGLHPAHQITIKPGTLLHSAIGQGSIGVNSLHRQSVASVPAPFIVSAWAEDGVVEAIESEAHPFAVGVQFHPEMMTETPVWENLFTRFVQAGQKSVSPR